MNCHRGMGALTSVLSALAAAILLAGCGSAATSGTEAGPAPQQAGPPALLELPAPSELAGMAAAPHAASYTEEGLIHHGKDYETDFPKRNVSVVGETASFEPSWSESTGLGPENLAFCIYEFAADGFDRDAQVRWGWEIAPADGEQTWLGLSNWSADSWEWYLLGPAGWRPFDTLDPYIGGTGLVFAAVVQTGTSVSRLRYIRLGPQQLYAQLSACPATGVGPLEVTLDARSSYSLAGDIVEAIWDLDGDGSYDVSSGALLEKDHTYDSPGQWQPRVMITSEYGVQATDSTVTRVDESWERVWGLDGRTIVSGMAVSEGSAVYAVGRQEMGAEDDDLLLLKYSLNGDFQWARTWGGPDYDYGMDVAVAAGGDAYVTGGTYSFGEGLTDLFVQRWDTAGNLVWTRTWGGESTDVGYGVTLIDDEIFIAGRTDSFGDGTGEVLLLAYDPDGEIAWQRAVGGGGQDIAFDVAAWRHPSTDARALYIAGTAYSFSAMGQALYVRFNGDGDLLNFDTWEAGYRSSAISIALALVIPSPRIFIAGDTWGTNNDALLLEAGSGAVNAMSWDSGYADVAYALTISGGRLIAAGLTQINSDNDDGLLLGYSLDFEPQFAWAWDVWEEWEDARFEALAPYPDSGVLIGGQYPYLSGTWLARATDTAVLSGAWVDRTGSVTVMTPEGVTTAPSQPAAEVTNGDETGSTSGQNAVLFAHPAT